MCSLSVTAARLTGPAPAQALEVARGAQHAALDVAGAGQRRHPRVRRRAGVSGVRPSILLARRGRARSVECVAPALPVAGVPRADLAPGTHEAALELRGAVERGRVIHPLGDWFPGHSRPGCEHAPKTAANAIPTTHFTMCTPSTSPAARGRYHGGNRGGPLRLRSEPHAPADPSCSAGYRVVRAAPP